MIRLLLPIIFFFFSAFIYAEKSKYQLGRGIQIGEFPLYVGGYFSVEYTHEFGKKRSLTLNELAIMAYGEKSKFSYMLELEAEDVYNEVIGDEVSEVVQENFHIERLYLNYEFNENYALRIGKYYSPVGLWNRIPINVLRDTSSNPSITSLLYPVFTSGIDMRYHSQREYATDIDILLQENKDIDKIIHNNGFNNFDINRHYSIGISLQKEQWTYQFNAAYFRIITGESYSYLLGAGAYKSSQFKFQYELGTQFNKQRSTIPYIGYLQGSYRIKEQHEAIVRVESYYDKVSDIKDSFVVMGYTYRPLYPIALKGEYQWHSLREENKLLLSISILF